MRLENVSKRTVTEEGVEQVNMCTPRNRVKRGVPMKETTPTIHFICYECSISFFLGVLHFFVVSGLQRPISFFSRILRSITISFVMSSISF